MIAGMVIATASSLFVSGPMPSVWVTSAACLRRLSPPSASAPVVLQTKRNTMPTQMKMLVRQSSTKAPDSGKNGASRRLSDILQVIADAPCEPGERIFLGHLIEIFGNRAFGVLIFVFALPVIVPIPVPGISAILGAPLLFLTWQLMRGKAQPWLPELMRNRSLKRKDFVAALRRALPWIRRLERLVGTRLIWLTGPRAEQVIGCLAFLLALVLFLPVPFGNSLPALGIAILALALLERDGVAVILGALVGCMAFGIVSGVILGALKAGIFLVQALILS